MWKAPEKHPSAALAMRQGGGKGSIYQMHCDERRRGEEVAEGRREGGKGERDVEGGEGRWRDGAFGVATFKCTHCVVNGAFPFSLAHKGHRRD